MSSTLEDIEADAYARGYRDGQAKAASGRAPSEPAGQVSALRLATCSADRAAVKKLRPSAVCIYGDGVAEVWMDGSSIRGITNRFAFVRAASPTLAWRKARELLSPNSKDQP